jgi:WD40 repeat protein
MRPSGSEARRAFLTIVAGVCLWAGCGDSPTAPGTVDPEAILRQELARTELTVSWYRGCIWQSFRQHLPSYRGQTAQFILADIRAIIASCQEAEGPGDGALEVTTSTTGEDLDGDGYSLTLDGGTAEAIGNDAVVTKSNLAPGDYQVELGDVAANCSVAGDNPRTVSVAAGATAETTFTVTCTALPPTEGALRVITTTSGSDLDPDGYTVSVGGDPGSAIGVEDSLEFPGLTPGDYQVELSDVAANCSVAGDNPRTVSVSAGATAETTFTVTCSAIVVPDEIVFARAGAGIWSIGADGSNAGQLTTVTSDITPDVSPDGATLVFSSGSGPVNIFTSDIDGSNRVQLTNSTNASRFNYDPEFSPDGSKIVFYSNRTSGNFHIWVMDADGSDPVQLTTTGQNGFPSWSADGTRILFTSNRDGNFEIYVMDADGSDQTRLTNNSATESRSAFSPDGTKIVFDTDRDGAFDIYLMDADGTNQVPLTTDAGFDAYPAWSPDGQRIAFTSDRDGSGDIWVMDADGSNQTDVSQTGSDTFATWMP